MAALSEEQILAINAIQGILAVSDVSPNYQIANMDFDNLNDIELLEIQGKLIDYVCLAIDTCDLNLVALAIKAGCDFSKRAIYVDTLFQSIFIRAKFDNDFFEIITILVNSGLKIDIQHPENKNSLLHIACLFGCSNFVKLLISLDASISVLNNRERTPLMFAAVNGDPKCVKLLIDAGADPWVRDCNLYNALDLININLTNPGKDAVVEIISATPKPKRSMLFRFLIVRKWIWLRIIFSYRRGVIHWIKTCIHIRNNLAH